MIRLWCTAFLLAAACGHVGPAPSAPAPAPLPAPTAPDSGPACDANGAGSEAPFARGAQLVEPYLILSDRPAAQRPEKQHDLRRAIACFERVIQLTPDNWRAMWLEGKAHQALAERDAAVQSFRAAYQHQPDDPNVGRELVLALIETGAHASAATIAADVADRNPDNAGLVANLAVALLLDAQIDRAQQAVERALRLDPSDTITLALRDVILDVATGRRPQPTSLRALEKR